MVKITFKRYILKTFSWRIVAASVTFGIIAILSNFYSALFLAGVASICDMVIKSIVYYLHEKLWDKSKYGLELAKKEGACIWLTGLPCSGKTTIAVELIRQLEEKLNRVEYLDGDIVRKTVCSDLGFSKADRNENIKRITLISSFLSQRAITVCSFVSPYRKAREAARCTINNFIEVFVDCPVDICIKRDVKGMYAKALAGEISGFTGIDDPYEKPENPEIVCRTDKETIDESVKKVIKYLEENKYI